MVRWVFGSILHGGPIELFLVPSSAPRQVCVILSGMVHIKEPLLLIGKCSPCGSSGLPLSLSECSFTTLCYDLAHIIGKSSPCGNSGLLSGPLLKLMSDAM